MASKLQKRRGTEVPNLNALAVLRSRIDPKRKATENDWDLITGIASEGEPPSGSFTAQDYCERFKCTNAAAQSRVKHLLHLKVLESGKYRLNGRMVRFYWTKKPEQSGASNAVARQRNGAQG